MPTPRCPAAHSEQVDHAQQQTRFMPGRLQNWLPVIGIVLTLLGLWEGYVRVFQVQKWLLPAPSVIAVTLVQSRELLWHHTLVTVLEIVLGFGLSLLCGVVLACGMAFSRTLERALYPFVIASQTIPIIVIAPLLLIWVGYGLAPKIIVVADRKSVV